MALAAKVVEQSDAENDADASKAGTRPSRIDNSTTLRATHPVLAKRVTMSPPAPPPEQCVCSGCKPEKTHSRTLPPTPEEKESSIGYSSKQRLTKVMKEFGRVRLEEFRLSVWGEASAREMGLTPLPEFLPDNIIGEILDRFATITTLAELVPFIHRIVGLVGYHGLMFEVLVELRGKFRTMKSKKK
ncbi:hypothetical protein B0H14DRAFT_3449814 [Mycena olivaceomarginata]|nr:hypothetical protein B0H14DRAFT_3449814 [Mycena olivaceomarginata]